MHLVGGELGAAQDEPHLWAVAVADGDVPAFLDHGDDVMARLLGGDVLVFHGLVLFVLDERVAADRDHGRTGSIEQDS